MSVVCFAYMYICLHIIFFFAWKNVELVLVWLSIYFTYVFTYRQFSMWVINRKHLWVKTALMEIISTFGFQNLPTLHCTIERALSGPAQQALLGVGSESSTYPFMRSTYFLFCGNVAQSSHIPSTQLSTVVHRSEPRGLRRGRPPWGLHGQPVVDSIAVALALPSSLQFLVRPWARDTGKWTARLSAIIADLFDGFSFLPCICPVKKDT